MAQTQWVGELRFMKSFLVSSLASCYDSSYLGEIFCFPEVTGIAAKFRFRESDIITQTR